MNVKIIKYSSYNKPITSYNPQNEVWIPPFEIRLDLKDAENSQRANKMLEKTPPKLPSSFEQQSTIAETKAQDGLKQKLILLPQLNWHRSGCRQAFLLFPFPSSELFPFLTIPATGYALQRETRLQKGAEMWSLNVKWSQKKLKQKKQQRREDL